MFGLSRKRCGNATYRSPQSFFTWARLAIYGFYLDLYQQRDAPSAPINCSLLYYDTKHKQLKMVGSVWGVDNGVLWVCVVFCILALDNPATLDLRKQGFNRSIIFQGANNAMSFGSSSDMGLAFNMT